MTRTLDSTPLDTPAPVSVVAPCATPAKKAPAKKAPAKKAPAKKTSKKATAKKAGKRNSR